MGAPFFTTSHSSNSLNSLAFMKTINSIRHGGVAGKTEFRQIMGLISWGSSVSTMQFPGVLNPENKQVQNCPIHFMPLWSRFIRSEAVLWRVI